MPVSMPDDGLNARRFSLGTSVAQQSFSDLSLTSTTNRATALDVCYSVYGDSTPSPTSLEQQYEVNAGTFCADNLKKVSANLTPVYENPFITATSRSVIGDIHRLSRQMSSVDVPRPLAVLCTLFRLRPLGNLLDDPLFPALRVWTDVSDVSESESFDGNRKVIVEHTLNILLLPGIHCEGPLSHTIQSSASSDSLINVPQIPLFPHASLQSPPPFVIPSLPIPGTSISVPSPLHSQLRIISRLSFNEQGRITHHRDIWDVKDVMGLVPGVSLAQWIGTRLAATGLSYLSSLLPTSQSRQRPEAKYPPNYTRPTELDLECGPSP